MNNMRPNMDIETGIHYGVIHQNNVSPYSVDEIVADGEDVIYESARKEFLQKLIDAVTDILEDECIPDAEEIANNINFDNVFEEWNDSYMNDNHHYVYEDGDYKLEMGDDGDIFVLKSPFFTYCKACSPCAPNAGYLMDQVSKEEYDEDTQKAYYHGLKKAYCFGYDWFENDKAPYTCYKVGDE